MKFYSKKLFVLTLIVLMSLLAACGENSNPASSDKNSENPESENNDAEKQTEQEEYFFTFANVTESGPLFVELGEGVKEAAEVAGIKLKTYDNKFDGPTALQNSKLMVQDKPDLIIEYNGVEGVGKSLEAVFKKAGIPTIAVNIPVPGSPLFNLSNEEIGIDTGKVVAEVAKEKGWTADNTTVLLVQSSKGGWEINNSVRYFYVTVAEETGMQEVKPEDITPMTTKIGEHFIQVDSEATLESSYQAVKNVIQTIPKDRNILLYSINDDSSLGAWRAIEDANRTEKTLVAGLGGSKQGLDELRNNENWVAEGSFFMGSWGQYIMAMGVAILNGAEPPEVTFSPQVVLTKKNVEEYYNGGYEPVVLPELPEQNQYLIETGVLQKFNNIEGLE
ncbi:sugar ABC transporter substrate-binding protein [Alkalihalobacillus deserti]|uniref:sugar ABC transporter substrate-binding protein n=1 Tax=Alkalihalobacillus deserti TaxID=2879466 RepID=UPI001D159FD8|nr:sugar ABC transporter substrate-binding protein [Alkalihalobacillus deserti]